MAGNDGGVKLRFAIVFLLVAMSISRAEAPPAPIPESLDPGFAFTDDAADIKHTMHMQLGDRAEQMRVPTERTSDEAVPIHWTKDHRLSEGA